MQRVLALVLAISLTSSACASSRATSAGVPVVAPATEPAISEFLRSLPPGSRVRLDITGGHTLRGTLLKATDEAVTIQQHTRLPEPPVAVAMRDVLRVTIDTPSSNGRTIAIGAAIGAGAAIALLWLIAAIALSD
jgi:hypothetical protein